MAEPVLPALVSRVPLQRLGSAAEVVDAILFLGRSPYITGEVPAIDGGLHLT